MNKQVTTNFEACMTQSQAYMFEIAIERVEPAGIAVRMSDQMHRQHRRYKWVETMDNK
jgi:hypothetical protein